MMKTRISKKLYKSLPTDVANELASLVDRYGFKSFTYRVKEHGWKLYAGEGDRISVIYGSNKASVEMVASHNVGGSGMSHSIGQEVVPPVGAVVFVVSYYSGFRLGVYNIVDDCTPALLSA